MWSTQAGFHTGFFVEGGKFGARLRMNFFFCLVVPIFQGYTFHLVYCVLSDKPHHLILTYCQSKRKVTQYHKAYIDFQNSGGGGDLRWGGKIPGSPPPPLCMKPWYTIIIMYSHPLNSLLILTV